MKLFTQIAYYATVAFRRIFRMQQAQPDNVAMARSLDQKSGYNKEIMKVSKLGLGNLKNRKGAEPLATQGKALTEEDRVRIAKKAAKTRRERAAARKAAEQ